LVRFGGRIQGREQFCETMHEGSLVKPKVP
jgi:hypothetical protein